MGVDPRVLPEERPLPGEWALTIIRSEAGSGPNTTHCICSKAFPLIVVKLNQNNDNGQSEERKNPLRTDENSK